MARKYHKSLKKENKNVSYLFCANENHIKYVAVLITSIIKSTDISKKFKDFFGNGVDLTYLNSFEKLNFNAIHKN